MAPVVSAAFVALGLLLVKLTGLLAGEYGRLKGVRREILALNLELSSMHAAVQKYTMLEDVDIQVKQWISMVRELAYDIEDCMDKFIHRLGNSRRHGGFKESFRKIVRSLKTLGARHGIASQIEDLKTCIKQVKELKNSYKLDDAPSSTSKRIAVDPRLSALFAEQAHLVGIDGPRDDLVKWMVEDGNNSSKHRRVLSIVGSGGLGKTTLANEVYHKIEEHFNCRAFVSISQNLDTKRVIKDIISQVSLPDGSTRDNDDCDKRRFILKLRELLQDKRYLIVIDDLWSTSAWDAIKYAFPDNNCSSRVMVTTRIGDVARSCCMGGDNRMHKMEVLSNLHSRILFHKRIFGSEENCPYMLEEASNEILKKCGGLPLAIISISGLLANKPAVKDEWEKVNRSIGSALEKDRSLDGMKSILLLSYNDLPPNAKTCFLYLSVFPEDHVIDRKRLVRRWIAEGFISEERGLSREEVAENYFYDLVNKNMVQPVDIGVDGKVRACQVHDMMFEIIVAISAENNFITVVGRGQTSLSNPQGFIRRLAVHHVDKEVASVLVNEDLRHVRSLTITSSVCIKHLPSLVKFEALRVLDFEDCKGLQNYIMDGMDKLFQLKYLCLRGTMISQLPSGIVMLGDLETLDLSDTLVRTLPDGIDQLTKLVHLIATKDTAIPNGIGNIRNLKIMSGFSITLSPLDVVKDLENLTSLNELCVHLNSSEPYKWYEMWVKAFLSSLCKLGSYELRSLEITVLTGSVDFLDSWCPPPYILQMFHMNTCYYFMKVPTWISPALTGMTYLGINVADLTDNVLFTLGGLPALLYLKLSCETNPKDRVIVKGIGFPSLKEFVLEGSAYIMFMKGAMPMLENLKVPFNMLVAKTYGFYTGIEHLPCLKKAHVSLVSIGVISSKSKAAAAAVITKEGGAHPNHPTVTIAGKWWFGDDNKEWN